MTAAVMGMSSPSRYGVAFGDQSHQNDTVLDRFFAGWENVFCAPRSMEKYSKEVAEEPDVLDYVFEHVESFTCADEESYQNDPFFARPLPYGEYPHFREFPPESKDEEFELKRENSLVEQGPNGAPALLAVTKRQPSLIAKMGEEGDLLDYCFEHVESYVCNNTDASTLDESLLTTSRLSSSKGRTPTRNTTTNGRRRQPDESDIPRVISTTRNKKKRRHRRRRKQNYYPDEEDNILLYYRPTNNSAQ